MAELASDAQAGGKRAAAIQLANQALQAFLVRNEPYYPLKRNDLYRMIQLSDDARLLPLANELYNQQIFTQGNSTIPAAIRKQAEELVDTKGGQTPPVDEGSSPTAKASDTGLNVASDTAPPNPQDTLSPELASVPGDELPEQIATRQGRFGNNASKPVEADARWLELLLLQYRILREQGKLLEAQQKLNELLNAYASLYARLMNEQKLAAAAALRNTFGDWMLYSGEYSTAKDVFSQGTNHDSGGGSSTNPGGSDATIAALAGRSAALDGLGDTQGASDDLDAALDLATKTKSPWIPSLKVMRERFQKGGRNRGGTTPAAQHAQGTPPASTAIDRLAELRARIRAAAELGRECSSLEEALKVQHEIVDGWRRLGRSESDAELLEAERGLAALLRVRGVLDEARALEAHLESVAARAK